MTINLNEFTDHIYQEGVLFNSYLELVPLAGKKRVILLNRKKYEFHSSCETHLKLNKSVYILPTFMDSSFKYKLELKSVYKDNIEKFGRFFIESLDGSPINLNGNLVTGAFIENGDRIELGGNLLIFRKDNEKEKTKLEYLSDRVTQSSLNILIEGETGTGKSFLAKKIHEQSERNGDFVHLNLSSFSHSLIESEIFGHIKGAFTGAILEKKGAIRSAHLGTLFLDEIDSLPIELQTKLLLFLDSKEVRPVGSDRIFKSDVRLIFASGRELQKLVKAGTMRKDFYFRLSSGKKISLKPLRENQKLIETFCLDFAMINHVGISEKLINFYKKYSWPGNIRQLKGHLEKKLLILSTKKITLDHDDWDLLESFQVLEDIVLGDGIVSWETLRREYCTYVFHQNHMQIGKSAELLDLSHSTLRKVLKVA